VPIRRARALMGDSSNRWPRTAESVGSPVAAQAWSFTSPSPTPRISRPPESSWTAAAWRVTYQGRRRGNGVTPVPRRIVLVALAIAARQTQGSQVGRSRAVWCTR